MGGGLRSPYNKGTWRSSCWLVSLLHMGEVMKARRVTQHKQGSKSRPKRSRYWSEMHQASGAKIDHKAKNEEHEVRWIEDINHSENITKMKGSNLVEHWPWSCCSKIRNGDRASADLWGCRDKGAPMMIRNVRTRLNRQHGPLSWQWKKFTQNGERYQGISISWSWV